MMCQTMTWRQWATQPDLVADRFTTQAFVEIWRIWRPRFLGEENIEKQARKAIYKGWGRLLSSVFPNIQADAKKGFFPQAVSLHSHQVASIREAAHLYLDQIRLGASERADRFTGRKVQAFIHQQRIDPAEGLAEILQVFEDRGANYQKVVGGLAKSLEEKGHSQSARRALLVLNLLFEPTLRRRQHIIDILIQNQLVANAQEIPPLAEKMRRLLIALLVREIQEYF